MEMYKEQEKRKKHGWVDDMRVRKMWWATVTKKKKLTYMK